jgi:hypothetical protein
MNVEEGTFPGEPNTTSGDSDSALRSYFARKRTISLRSSLFLIGVSALVAVVSPKLGLDLAVGGVLGVANILLVMRNNERLVDGRRSRGIFAASNMVRIFVVAAIPVMLAIHSPWWSMGVYFAGFFTPLAWYSVELQRWYRRGT